MNPSPASVTFRPSRHHSGLVTRAALLVAATVLAGFSSLARADWICSAKEREATAKQKEMFELGAAAMRTALQPPPEGWTMSMPNVRSRSGKFCPDFKNDPVAFGSSVNYFVKPTAENLRQYRAAQIASKRELESLRTLPADVQEKVDALDAQSTSARKEAREAERVKDQSRAKLKYSEAQDFSRKSYQVRSDFTTTILAKERAIYEKYEPQMALNRDIVIAVSLEANGAIRRQAGAEGQLIGSNAPTNQATDKIVRIELVIDGRKVAKPEHIAIVKGLIDMARLKAMVGGAMPTREELQVQIASQNEAIALREKQAREFERAAANEERRAEEAAHIAKREAAAAGADIKSPATANYEAEASASAPAGTQTKVEKPAATTTPPTASATDKSKEAKDAVNKLRGLFGR